MSYGRCLKSPLSKYPVSNHAPPRVSVDIVAPRFCNPRYITRLSYFYLWGSRRFRNSFNRFRNTSIVSETRNRRFRNREQPFQKQGTDVSEARDRRLRSTEQPFQKEFTFQKEGKNDSGATCRLCVPSCFLPPFALVLPVIPLRFLCPLVVVVLFLLLLPPPGLPSSSFTVVKPPYCFPVRTNITWFALAVSP